MCAYARETDSVEFLASSREVAVKCAFGDERYLNDLFSLAVSRLCRLPSPPTGSIRSARDPVRGCTPGKSTPRRQSLRGSVRVLRPLGCEFHDFLVDLTKMSQVRWQHNLQGGPSVRHGTASAPARTLGDLREKNYFSKPLANRRRRGCRCVSHDPPAEFVIDMHLDDLLE